MPLRFAEEVLLVLLDQDAGGIFHTSQNDLDLLLSGATLMDLALEDRIDTDPERLVLTDSTPLDDDLLDPALAEIAAAPDPAGENTISGWLERLAAHGPAIRRRALERLAAAKILESAEDGFQFLRSDVARSRMYPARDGQAEQEVLLRIMRVLFTDEIPSPRDIVIVSLLAAGGQFESVLSPSERAQVQDRIDLISRMDHIGRTVVAAVRAAAAHARPARPAAKTAIPRAPGVPLLGNVPELTRDVYGFLVKSFRELGPVFRVQVLRKKVIVLAGLEANEFIGRNGDVCLTTHWAYAPFAQQLGARHSLVGMSGQEHLRMRRAVGSGYNRRAFEGALAEAQAVVRREIARWKPGDVFRPRKVMQRIIFQQVATVASREPAPEYLPYVTFFLQSVFRGIETALPFDRLHPLKMRRARAKIDELYRHLLYTHGEGKPPGARYDLVDMVLDLHRSDPVFMPECDLKDALLVPFIAGVDTVGNTCSFLLYDVLKQPALLARIREEVDAHMAGDGLDAATLRKLDVTRRTVMESNRLRPVAPTILRTAMNTFEFAGYRIPAGENVYVASGTTHFLPEHFPNPERFDIDRYGPERAEHKQPFAYAPFGLGRHKCLGAPMAEPLAMLALATIVREAELEMLPRDYDLRVSVTTVPTPSKEFRVRYLGPRRA